MPYREFRDQGPLPPHRPLHCDSAKNGRLTSPDNHALLLRSNRSWDQFVAIPGHGDVRPLIPIVDGQPSEHGGVPTVSMDAEWLRWRVWSIQQIVQNTSECCYFRGFSIDGRACWKLPRAFGMPKIADASDERLRRLEEPECFIYPLLAPFGEELDFPDGFGRIEGHA